MDQERRRLAESDVAAVLGAAFDELRTEPDERVSADDEDLLAGLDLGDEPSAAVEGPADDARPGSAAAGEARTRPRHGAPARSRRKVDTETTHSRRPAAGKAPGGGRRSVNVYLPARSLEILHRAYEDDDLSFSELVSIALTRRGDESASEDELREARRGRRKTGGSEPRILRLLDDELASLDELARRSNLPRNRMVVVLLDRVSPTAGTS
jgi:hypothetical protein